MEKAPKSSPPEHEGTLNVQANAGWIHQDARDVAEVGGTFSLHAKMRTK